MRAMILLIVLMFAWGCQVDSRWTPTPTPVPVPKLPPEFHVQVLEHVVVASFSEGLTQDEIRAALDEFELRTPLGELMILCVPETDEVEECFVYRRSYEGVR